MELPQEAAMKRVLGTLATLIPILLAVSSGSHGQTKPAEPAGVVLLRVEGEVPQPQKLTAADLAKLPRRSLKARDHAGKESEFEGVVLVEFLKLAGVKLGTDLKGPALAQYMVVEASDGYRAVFALPELDPAFTEAVILLADRRDGQPLSAAEGPLRIVVPGEKRHARWVRQVIVLRVGRA
jgi:DMSO/TMAO reductase YedYZ molybdopterin-dependent catalytic subunit